MEKSQHVALNTFKEIKSVPANFDKNEFWSNKADLVLTLEILDKNEFIESDLSEILVDYDDKLRNYLCQKRLNNIQELPYYVQLILNRTRHSKLNKDLFSYKIALINVADEIISQIDTMVLAHENISRHLYSLVQIYNLNIYTTPIYIVLKKIAENMEIFVKKSNFSFSTIELSNLCIYPLICTILSKKTEFNWGQISKSYFQVKESIKNIDIDYFYFINSLLRWSRKTSDNKIINLIEKELLNIANLLKDQKNNQNSYLLALTINSFLNKELSSWDEILLIPRY